MQKNLHMKAEPDSIRHLHVFSTALVTAGLALLLGACASSDNQVAYGGAMPASPPIGAGRVSSYSEAPSTSVPAPVMPASPPAGTKFWSSRETTSKTSPGLDERPGLGTKLGWEYHDSSVATLFYRRNQTVPDATSSFHYNDAEGAKAMAELAGNASKHRGSFKLANGRLKASLEMAGEKLDWYESGGRIFVIGEPVTTYSGGNYAIELQNTCKERVEVVVSVDGLDVLSGTPASMSKRGYVIPKNGTITIRGMRSGGKMHTFQFGSVRDSQAAKSGGEKGARNVGVIGVAVYVEDEAAAKLARIKEGMTRDDARAFPGS